VVGYPGVRWGESFSSQTLSGLRRKLPYLADSSEVEFSAFEPLLFMEPRVMMSGVSRGTLDSSAPLGRIGEEGPMEDFSEGRLAEYG
jgi:hypothetical protein